MCLSTLILNTLIAFTSAFSHPLMLVSQEGKDFNLHI